MRINYIVQSAVKKRIKETGKRCSIEFIYYLDQLVAKIVGQAIKNSLHFKTIRPGDLGLKNEWYRKINQGWITDT